MIETSLYTKFKLPYFCSQIIQSILKWITIYDRFPLLQDTSTKKKVSIIVPLGLRNLGNTCFLNSILQALSSFEQLHQYLAYPNVSAKSRSFSSKLLSCLQGIRPHQRELFSYNPRDVYDELVKFNKSFHGGQQQDAQELFQTISTIVGNEKNQYYRRYHMSMSSIIGTNATMNSSINGVDNHIAGVALTTISLQHSYDTISSREKTMNPFQGLLASRMRCTKCQHERISLHEAFTCLSLPIQSTSKRLYDCLENFIVGETIDGVQCDLCSYQATKNSCEYAVKSANEKMEMEIHHRVLDAVSKSYVCGSTDVYLRDLDSLEFPISSTSSLPSTDHESMSELSDSSLDSMYHMSLLDSVKKIRCEVIRSTRISRYPTLLCLHLQRLQYDVLSNGMKKIQQHINFPLRLTGKDLMSFHHTTMNSPVHSTNWQYSLKAVVVHIGHANAGHYVTYSLVQVNPAELGQWMLFSDDQVQKVSVEQVLSAQAYMLFYELHSLS